MPHASGAARGILGRLRDALWRWPEGWLWRLSEPLTLRSREAKFALFLREIGAHPADILLDVGGGGDEVRGGNYFERRYPYPERMVACVYGLTSELGAFRRHHPQVRVVAGDGRCLPFTTNAFAVAVSNAVIEHVGPPARQRAFVADLLRVAPRVFLATPNRWFPVDTHTLIPLAHYLPPRPRFSVYRSLGRSYWASIDTLNLLSARQLLALVPPGVEAKLVRLRLLGLTHSLVLILRRPARGLALERRGGLLVSSDR